MGKLPKMSWRKRRRGRLSGLRQQQPLTCQTDCHHIFHRTCLGTWIEKTNTCPTCRPRIKSLDGRPIEDKDLIASDWQQTEAGAVKCYRCAGSVREEDVLVCSGCRLHCHIWCLQNRLSSVPEGQWFCPECSKGMTDLQGVEYIVVHEDGTRLISYFPYGSDEKK